MCIRDSSQEEFFAQVNKIGLSVIGQSEGIAVADKKMYALRDVTAVSYTHLATPTMQMHWASAWSTSTSSWWSASACWTTSSWAWSPTRSVSYTHLDVYKRQAAKR